MKNHRKILEKAKKTRYKHKDWYRGTNRSVYDIMLELTKTNDFIIDFSRNLSAYELREMGYAGELNRSSTIQWLIDTEKYDKLLIRFTGSEGGSDKGKLKIQTYLILKNM